MDTGIIEKLMKNESAQYILSRCGAIIGKFDVFKVEDTEVAGNNDRSYSYLKSPRWFMRADHFWYWRADSPWKEDGSATSEDTWNIISADRPLLRCSEMAGWDLEKGWCRAVSAIQKYYSSDAGIYFNLLLFYFFLF